MQRLEMGVQASDVRRVREMVEGRGFEHLVPLSQLSALCDQSLVLAADGVQ